MITLDGSEGEGGGQVVRSALSLAMITGRGFRLINVRANRDRPGLRPQHAKAVETAAMLCGAEVRGGEVGSRELVFKPGPLAIRDLRLDIGTAGSTALVLQTLQLPIGLEAEHPTTVQLVGGTFNLAAPSYPFLKATWCAHLFAMGLNVEVRQESAGFYPSGGGRLVARIEPGRPKLIRLLERPEVRRIHGTAGVVRLDEGIARRMRTRIKQRLYDHDRELEPELNVVAWPGRSPGAAVSVTVEFEDPRIPPSTFVGLGEKGKRAEVVADEAVDELLGFLESGTVVDRYSADQIMLPLAVAEGSSVYTTERVTDHLLTHASTIRAFLDKPIRIIEARDGLPARVEIGDPTHGSDSDDVEQGDPDAEKHPEWV